MNCGREVHRCLHRIGRDSMGSVREVTAKPLRKVKTDLISCARGLQILSEMPSALQIHSNASQQVMRAGMVFEVQQNKHDVARTVAQVDHALVH
jgi:hypothetical protein